MVKILKREAWEKVMTIRGSRNGGKEKETRKLSYKKEEGSKWVTENVLLFTRSLMNSQEHENILCAGV